MRGALAFLAAPFLAALLFAGSALPQAQTQGGGSGGSGITSGDVAVTSGNAIVSSYNGGTAFGTAAAQNTGTSGATVPFLNGANTWANAQTLSNATNSFGSSALASSLNINIQAAAGQSRYFSWKSGTSLRWQMGADNTSESGSNAGSNLGIFADLDSGSLSGTLLLASRASGPQGNGSPYFAQIAPGVFNISRATTPNGTVGNLYSWSDLQPTQTLGSNPITTTNGNTRVVLAWTANGLNTSSYVGATGAAAVNGVTLNGWYPVTAVTTNTVTIDSGQTANAGGSGGGAAVAVVPYFPDSASSEVFTSHSGAPGFELADSVSFIADPDFLPTVAGGLSNPAYQARYTRCLSPPDATQLNVWNETCYEQDMENRGADQGYQDDIYTSLNPTTGYLSIPENLIQFPTHANNQVTATFTNSSATITGTGLPSTTNQAVTFLTTGTLPTNFATATAYYVLAGSTSSSITVAATPGGTAIVAGSAGSGTQSVSAYTEGKNATAAFWASHNQHPNSTGYSVKWYSAYLCEEDGLVSNTAAPGGVGGNCITAIGARDGLGTNPFATTSGSNVVTVTVLGSAISLVKAHNTPTSVYIPVSVTVNATVIAAGVYSVSNVTDFTFQISGVGNANASASGGGTTVPWVSFANDVPNDVMLVDGEYAHGIVQKAGAKIDSGYLIEGRVGTGLSWTDGTGTVSAQTGGTGGNDSFTLSTASGGVAGVALTLDSVYHLTPGNPSTGPAASTGAASIAANATDQRFKIVSGTSVTAISWTFGKTWANTPVCVATEQGTSPVALSVSSLTTSGGTVNAATALTATTINVICE